MSRFNSPSWICLSVEFPVDWTLPYSKWFSPSALVLLVPHAQLCRGPTKQPPAGDEAFQVPWIFIIVSFISLHQRCWAVTFLLFRRMEWNQKAQANTKITYHAETQLAQQRESETFLVGLYITEERNACCRIRECHLYNLQFVSFLWRVRENLFQKAKIMW